MLLLPIDETTPRDRAILAYCHDVQVVVNPSAPITDIVRGGSDAIYSYLSLYAVHVPDGWHVIKWVEDLQEVDKKLTPGHWESTLEAAGWYFLANPIYYIDINLEACTKAIEAIENKQAILEQQQNL